MPKPCRAAHAAAALLTLALLMASLACTSTTGQLALFAVVPDRIDPSEPLLVPVTIQYRGTHRDAQSTVAVSVTTLDGALIAQSSRPITGHEVITVPPPHRSGDHHILIEALPGPDHPGAVHRQKVHIGVHRAISIHPTATAFAPGQHITVLIAALRRDATPAPGELQITYREPSGVVVFTEEIQLSEHGLAQSTMELSRFTPTGPWTITASDGFHETRRTIQVKPPEAESFSTALILDSPWTTPSDQTVTGTLAVNHPTGQGLVADAIISLQSAPVAVPERWTTVSSTEVAFDGQTRFTLPLPPISHDHAPFNGPSETKYRVHATTTDQTTLTQRTIHTPLSAATHDVVPTAVPLQDHFQPGLPVRFALITTDPTGARVPSELLYQVTQRDQRLRRSATVDETSIPDHEGQSNVTIATQPSSTSISVAIKVPGHSLTHTVTVYATPVRPKALQLLQLPSPAPESTAYRIVPHGFDLPPEAAFRWVVTANGQALKAGNTRDTFQFPHIPAMFPAATVTVYYLDPKNGPIVHTERRPLPRQTLASISGANTIYQVKPGQETEHIINSRPKDALLAIATPAQPPRTLERLLNLDSDRLSQNLRIASPAHRSVYTTDDSEVLRDPEAYLRFGTPDAALQDGITLISNQVLEPARIITRYDHRAGPAEHSVLSMMAINPGNPDPDAPILPEPRNPLLIPRSNPPALLRYDTYLPVATHLPTDDNGAATVAINGPTVPADRWRVHLLSLNPREPTLAATANLDLTPTVRVTAYPPPAALQGDSATISIHVSNYTQQAAIATLTTSDDTGVIYSHPLPATVTLPPRSETATTTTLSTYNTPRESFTVNGVTDQTVFSAAVSIPVAPGGHSKTEIHRIRLNPGETYLLELGEPAYSVPDSFRARLRPVSSPLHFILRSHEHAVAISTGDVADSAAALTIAGLAHQFLRADQSPDSTQQIQIRRSARLAYQQLLSSRLPDGSFAMRPQSDTPSTWATATAIIALATARNAIHISPSVIDQAAQYLAARQDSNGSLLSAGPVHQPAFRDHQPIRSTATAALAFHHAGRVDARNLALNHLESHISSQLPAHVLAPALLALATDQRDPQHLYLTLTALADWPPQDTGETRSQVARSLIPTEHHAESEPIFLGLQDLMNIHGMLPTLHSTAAAATAFTEQIHLRSEPDTHAALTISTAGRQQLIRLPQDDRELSQPIIFDADETSAVITSSGTKPLHILVERTYNLLSFPEPSRDDNRLEITAAAVPRPSKHREPFDLAFILTYLTDRKFPSGPVILNASLPTGFHTTSPFLAYTDSPHTLPVHVHRASNRLIVNLNTINPNDTVTVTVPGMMIGDNRAQRSPTSAHLVFQPQINAATYTPAVVSQAVPEQP